MEERSIQLRDLKSISLFKALPKKTLNEILRFGTIRVYQPDAKLYKAGDINTKILIVLRGSLSINYAHGNQAVPIEVISQGNLWGYTTLLHPGKKYPYSVINEKTVVEVIELPIAKLLALISKASSSHSVLLFELARLQSQRSRVRQQKIALLYSIANITRCMDGAATRLNQIIEIISQYMGFKYGLIAWFDDISKNIVIEASLGYPKKIAEKNFSLSSDTILSQVYNTNASMLINKDNFEKKYKIVSYHQPTMLIAPLCNNNITYGAFLCADKEKNEFTSDDILTLTAATPMITSALVTYHQHKFDQETRRIKKDFV